MKHYSVDPEKKWDYENGFYLTCENSRIGKFLNHLEIYKKIVSLPGDILEFGVYKGTSLIRLLSFRHLLENDFSRKVIGFDAFGKFPNDLELESDRKFVKTFEGNGGFGISSSELHEHLKRKGIQNYTLVEGDILKTLPNYLMSHPGLKISLIHIDVDVYEPTKFILETLWDRVVRGGIIMFDDYSVVEGETKAVDEYFESLDDIEMKKPSYNYIPSYVQKK